MPGAVREIEGAGGDAAYAVADVGDAGQVRDVAAAPVLSSRFAEARLACSYRVRGTLTAAWKQVSEGNETNCHRDTHRPGAQRVPKACGRIE